MIIRPDSKNDIKNKKVISEICIAYIVKKI